MARTKGNRLQQLITDFVSRLTTVIGPKAAARVRMMIDSELGDPRRATGRPRKRRKGGSLPRPHVSEKQLCPVPACRYLAIPTFGMVCAEHKNLPKSLLKRYREARQQAKREAVRIGRAWAIKPPKRIGGPRIILPKPGVPADAANRRRT
jgi:hypothetical protein